MLSHARMLAKCMQRAPIPRSTATSQLTAKQPQLTDADFDNYLLQLVFWRVSC